MAANLSCDKFWVNKNMYHDAEKKYYENFSKGDLSMRKLAEDSFPKTSLAGEVAKARQHLKSSLECMDQNLSEMGSLSHMSLPAVLEKIGNAIANLTKRIEVLEKKSANLTPQCPKENACESNVVSVPSKNTTTAPAPEPESKDSDLDLFGSDSEEEDEESKKLREKRLAAYAEKKSKKAAVVAKSNIILDIKPWDDETDMKEMEKEVRAIEMDGLVWGASRLVHVAFKIFKLQITCVVEDEKVSVDLLTETIESIKDYVQSVDIAAFNKV